MNLDDVEIPDLLGDDIIVERPRPAPIPAGEDQRSPELIAIQDAIEDHFQEWEAEITRQQE